MLKVSGLKIKLRYGQADLKEAVCKKLRIDVQDIDKLFLLRRSVDARDKGDLCYVVSVAVSLRRGEKAILDSFSENIVARYAEKEYRTVKPEAKRKTVVVGFGPAGMFAALLLARCGLNPVVLERGGDADERIKKVKEFNCGGKLDEDCNIQFGEGGAGTFSDGKLNTGTGDERIRFVLKTFAEFGAPPEILYDAKPHIGTDKLVEIVKNIRKEILSLGGEIHFHKKFTGLKTKDNRVLAACCGEEEYPCDNLILAIGHSSRDTFSALFDRGIAMEQKEFSVGVRIEHLQRKIDFAQYGKNADVKALGSADYKLWCHLKDGRGVYTFCMCPGGLVAAAASEAGGIVTNGMSNFLRDGRNANSGLLVNVGAREFGSEHPLAGMEFQRKLERAAFSESGSYAAPAARVEDFLKGRASKSFGEVLPTYPIGTVMSDFKRCLPKEITDSVRLGIAEFAKKLRGFDHPDAVVTGVETRSSSPVRILRKENFMAGIEGLYPCGEGAGYAGGITSAAVDGLKCAECAMKK